MNDAPIKQMDAIKPETQSPVLSTPHFDEIAVAIAQPVEPIARRGDWFAALEKPRMMIAILLVAALFGTTALALTLQLRRPPQVETATSEVQTEELAPEPELPLGAAFEEPRPVRARPKVRRIHSTVIVMPARPVARRVGVITGTSDRP